VPVLPGRGYVGAPAGRTSSPSPRARCGAGVDRRRVARHAATV